MLLGQLILNTCLCELQKTQIRECNVSNLQCGLSLCQVVSQELTLILTDELNGGVCPNWSKLIAVIDDIFVPQPGWDALMHRKECGFVIQSEDEMMRLCPQH